MGERTHEGGELSRSSHTFLCNLDQTRRASRAFSTFSEGGVWAVFGVPVVIGRCWRTTLSRVVWLHVPAFLMSPDPWR